MKLLVRYLLFFPFFVVAQQGKKRDALFHYSTMDAMRNAVYSGNLSVAELSAKGNFGLGTYNWLDGEMIAMDGVFYRVASDGVVQKADMKRLTPFASVTFFKTDYSFKLNEVRDFEILKSNIINHLPSTNRFYAIRIECDFANVVVGGANKVNESEAEGLGKLMTVRPIYKKENVKGTIVGFFCPSYVGGIDLSPFHFHFISDDHKFAGHLINGTLREGADINVFIDEKNDYELKLPPHSKGYQNRWKQASSQNVY